MRGVEGANDEVVGSRRHFDDFDLAEVGSPSRIGRSMRFLRSWIFRERRGRIGLVPDLSYRNASRVLGL